MGGIVLSTANTTSPHHSWCH